MKRAPEQMSFSFDAPRPATPPSRRFPQTRYLGSKHKLLGLLEAVFSELEFETALDPFSGTGAVAYLLKQMGARVTASDALAFNVGAARALVENQETRLAGRINGLRGCG